MTIFLTSGRFLQKVLALAVAIVAGGCDRLQDAGDTGEQKIVARAGDENLSHSQFARNFISTGIIRDSVYNARKFIESWATEALFYQEALDKLSGDELNVEEQVENYRRSLLNFAYQTRLIENNLDTVVSGEEIQAYYDENRDNFVLRENIVKVHYIKVPVLAPGLEKIKKLVHSNKPKDQEQLITLCLQNAENYFMNDSTWLFVDDVRKEIPQLRDDPDYSLMPGRVLEFTDEQYYYYLKVIDIKIKNALSPLNFERANIRQYILNRRKTQLIMEYKRKLIEKAKQDRTFVVY